MIRKCLLIGVVFSFVWCLIPSSANCVEEDTLKNSFIIFGYAFVDEDKSGIMLSDNLRITELKMELWQGNDLLNKTKTDDFGYYEFHITKPKGTYYIKCEELENYEPTKLVETSMHGNRFSYQKEKKIYSQPIQLVTDKYQNNIGFYEKEYLLSFDDNLGIGELEKFQHKFHRNEIIHLPDKEYIERQGYVFLGWSSFKDGKGVIYSNKDVLLMPSRPVKLYAIWKKTMSHYPQNNKQELDKPNQSISSTQYILPILWILVLIVFGGLIVKKSLKQRKNR